MYIGIPKRFVNVSESHRSVNIGVRLKIKSCNTTCKLFYVLMVFRKTELNHVGLFQSQSL